MMIGAGELRDAALSESRCHGCCADECDQFGAIAGGFCVQLQEGFVPIMRV